MNKLILSIYFSNSLLYSRIFVCSSQNCPSDCTCNSTIVDCKNANLSDFPLNLPTDTKILNLSNNFLQQIRARDFVGLADLTTVNLSDNEVDQVEDFCFVNVRKLDELDLSQNQLTFVQMNGFAGLTQLSLLNLANNLIHGIDREAFHDLPNLKILELQLNNLTTVPYDSLVYLHKLRRFKIDKSALDCACDSPDSANRMPTCDTTSTNNNRQCHMMNEADNTTVVKLIISDDIHLVCKASAEETYVDCKNIVAIGRSRRKKRMLNRRRSRQIHVEADIGSNAYLPCPYDNVGRRIFWYFDQSPINPNERMQLMDNGRLFIKRVSPRDAGTFSCFLGGFGRGDRRRDSSVKLSVRQAPEFTVVPHDLFAFEGSRVNIACESVGYPTPLISWYKDNAPLRQSRRITLERNNTNLQIYPLLRDDAGVYSCHASNVLGTRKVSGVIYIKSSMPPKITLAPTSQLVALGGTASFQCRATGEPMPKIVWSVNGSPIPTVKGHFEISAQNTLYVHDVTNADDGHYTCQAANDVGAMSADAILTIQKDPSPATTVGPLGPINRNVIVDTVRQATFDIDRAINSTRLKLYNNKLKDPSELLAVFRFPGSHAIELARSREIYEQTLRLLKRYISSGLQFEELDKYAYENILSPAHLQMISELSGCNVHHEEPNCNDMCFHTKYRTYDGTCNNLQRPMTGSSHSAFKRLVPPIYENGFDQPVGWNRNKLYNGFKKPNPRTVVTQVVSTSTITPDPQHSHMLMQWGQFLDHDLDFAILSPSIEQFDGGIRCKVTCQNSPPCFNIEVPPDDHRIRSISCIEMERSSAVCGSGETSLFFNKIQPREQINQITSYIDASNVYASTEREALDLRDLFSDHGLLKFDITSHAQKPFLPFNRDAMMDCRRNRSIEHNVRCFLAGDHRANEQLGLLAMHTLWLREHNRLAGSLFKINPHWDGEKLFQEARKIVGAQMQVITYKHWLPKILGPFGMDILGQYRGYDPDVDPSIANAFGTAAFRFGHTLIQPLFLRLNKTFQEIPDGHILLHNAFFAPDKILNEGGIDPLLRGLFASPAKLLMSDQFLNLELTEKLFAKAHRVALDLASINIQRGRDHAIPGYLEYRRFCNLSTPDHFEGLASDIPDRNLRSKLKSLYGHPANIDLFVGGLSEAKLPGAKIGPTFVCIIADQFRRLRDGDRFYYENPGIFTQLQLIEIKKASLARVLCDNGDEIDRVQPDVFDYPGDRDAKSYSECRNIPEINLNMWQECCSESLCGQKQTIFNSEEGVAEHGKGLRRSKRKLRSENSHHHQNLRKRVNEMEQTIGKLEQKLSELLTRKTEL